MVKKKAVNKVKKKPIKRKKSVGKRSSLLKRIFFFVISIIAVGFGFLYLYINFNYEDIIRQRIEELYCESQISEYYSLDYGKIRINPFATKLRIFNVSFIPLTKEKPKYFKKNGSMEVKMGAIRLSDFDIREFLNSNKITVNKIAFSKVDVKLNTNGSVFQPFAFIQKKEKNDSLSLDVIIGSFTLKGASLTVNDKKNSKNSTSIDRLDFEMNKLSFNKRMGDFSLALADFKIKIKDVKHSTAKGMQLALDVFRIETSGISIAKNDKGFQYSYDNNIVKLINPKLATADGVYGISSKSIVYDANTNALVLNNTMIKPQISRHKFAAKNKYQKQLFDIEIAKMELDDIDIEKLKSSKGIFAEHIGVQGVKVIIYNDKHKPLDTRRYPKYLAQQILAIKMPLEIRKVSAEDVDIKVDIFQADNRRSKIDINDLSVQLIGLQNRHRGGKLQLLASGKVHGAIPFNVKMKFNYGRSYFTYSGQVMKSNLRDLAKPIASFAPVKVNNGRIKSIKFSGYANSKMSKGRMTFLYNNLNIELQRVAKDNTDLSDHVLSILANSVIYSSNPTTKGALARNVDFEVEREMHKGFVNLLIKSVLAGAKESVLPSRSNRKKHRRIKKSLKR